MGERFGRRMWKSAEGCFVFFCPGCGKKHSFTTKDAGMMLSWDFNESGDYPTVSPDIKVQYGANGRVCHFFISNGFIQYLGDSYHYLAGQTVEMPDWLEEEQDGE